MQFREVRLLQLALAAVFAKFVRILALNYQSILEILKSFVLETILLKKLKPTLV